MRQQPSGRRPRGRSNRKQFVSPKSQIYDSHGPDVRVRGNAVQVYEKYLNLGRDATSSGDRVAAESYYQFAEHYFRILNDSTDPQRGAPERPQRPPGSQPYPVNAEQPFVDGATSAQQASGPGNGQSPQPADKAPVSAQLADKAPVSAQPSDKAPVSAQPLDKAPVSAQPSDPQPVVPQNAHQPLSLKPVAEPAAAKVPEEQPVIETFVPDEGKSESKPPATPPPPKPTAGATPAEALARDPEPIAEPKTAPAEEKPRRRGRPRKSEAAKAETAEPKTPKRRGRPPKVKPAPEPEAEGGEG